MGVDIASVSGIGIETHESELIENLSEIYHRLYDDEMLEDILYDYNSEIISIKYGGGYYSGDHSYFIVLKDLFKYGRNNIQKRIDEFIEWLSDNNFSTEITEINFPYYC